MDIEAYLDRIGYRGPRSATLETLKGVQQAHALSIPWENLDVQFGRTLTTDVAAAYDKLVTRRRGGWCYENNGVLGWALEELGFRPVRFCAGGMTPDGVRLVGNHLALRVEVGGETWIVDNGGGDMPAAPYQLIEGPFSVGPFTYRVEKLEGGWWRVHNHPLGVLPFTDFHPDLTDEALLSQRCAVLCGDPQSVFVLNAVAMAQWNGRQATLRGRIFVEHDGQNAEKRLIADADDYVRTLRERFRLDLPEAAGLWPKILARHEALFAAPPA